MTLYNDGMELVLEIKEQEDGTIINEDYWLFRVKVSDKQSIIGFPKFCTIGIGFAKENDWNTNLPYTCKADEIFNHISHNKGDDSIPNERCIKAIEIVQAAIIQYKKS